MKSSNKWLRLPSKRPPPARKMKPREDSSADGVATRSHARQQAPFFCAATRAQSGKFHFCVGSHLARLGLSAASRRRLLRAPCLVHRVSLGSLLWGCTFSNAPWSLTRSSKTMAYALESLPTVSPSSGRFTSGVPSFSHCFLPFSSSTGEGAFASSQIFLPLMHFHLTSVGSFTLEILDLTCSANLTGCGTITEGEALDVGCDNLISESSEGKQAVPQDEAVAKVVVVAKVGIVD